jgi:hypothetical protein
MESELEFYGLTEYKNGSVEVRPTQINGRCDDYLSKNLRFDSPLLPVLFINGKLWMSMTYMEMQSMFVPVQRAQGKVATGGLGLGYYALRAASDDRVESVDVYEENEDVINFFKKAFSDREEMKKINFFHGNVRKTMNKMVYDFVFMDIYPTVLPDEVIDDIRLFTKNNTIGEYRFWGQEKAILQHINSGDFASIDSTEKVFFQYFLESEGANLYSNFHNEDFCREVCEELGRC